jgi:hypothetical protein
MAFAEPQLHNLPKCTVFTQHYQAQYSFSTTSCPAHALDAWTSAMLLRRTTWMQSMGWAASAAALGKGAPAVQEEEEGTDLC